MTQLFEVKEILHELSLVHRTRACGGGIEATPPGRPGAPPPGTSRPAAAAGVSAQDPLSEIRPLRNGILEAPNGSGPEGEGNGPQGRDPLLDERERTHGDFASVARTAQSLKFALAGSSGGDVEREALESIATKLARIRHGDAQHLDHWRDIAGYALLVAEHLEARGRLSEIDAE